MSTAPAPSASTHRGDAELWRAASSDADAFGDLCARHIVAVHAAIRRRVGSEPAADLTAETFAQAWRGRRRLRPQADDEVIAWLHGIARNLAYAYLRTQVVETKARRRLGMQLDIAGEDAYSALDDSLDAAAAEPQLRAALRRLPASQREAVTLRVVYELAYAEIGQTLGCSEPVARMKVARGLRALRAELHQLGATS